MGYALHTSKGLQKQIKNKTKLLLLLKELRNLSPSLPSPETEATELNRS